MYWDKARTDSMGSIDASGVTPLAFAPGQVIHVKRLVFVTTVAQTVANSVVTVAVRDVDDGNSTTVGTFTLPFTGSAADDVQFVNLGEPETTGSVSAIDGSLVFDNEPGGLVIVNPGQEIAITSDGVGTGGTYNVYVEYQPQGFQEYADSDYSPVELTFTHA